MNSIFRILITITITVCGLAAGETKTITCGDGSKTVITTNDHGQTLAKRADGTIGIYGSAFTLQEAVAIEKRRCGCKK